MKNISVYSVAEIPLAAKLILEYADKKKIFCFYGELGAGKTTLIKEICRILGVNDKGSSPTFALVNEYRIGTLPVYHLDLYRLKDEKELFDIGFEEYVFSGNYCFIEWPEKAVSMFNPVDSVSVRIEMTAMGRIITVS